MNYELRIKNWISENKYEFFILIFIIFVGAFLRLYKIDQYMTFLGDEGRDAIIVRRLLVYLDPILIGPGTSIGNMYLGPLYYYLMAPALLLANFNPAGPAVMVALLGVAAIFLVWLVAREWFGHLAAWVAATLYAVSPTVIIYSRSSWNPNIMPFFSLLSIYSIWKVYESRGASRGVGSWLVVLGISYAFVLQSHYLGLLLAPTIILFWILTLRNLRLIGNCLPAEASAQAGKLEIRNFLKYSFIGLLVFIFLMSPLVIFDARHGWINFKAMKKFFSARQETVSIRPWNAIPKIYPLLEKLNTRLVAARNETMGKLVSIFTIVWLGWILIKIRKKYTLVPSAYKLLFSWLGFAILGMALYKQEIYDHYFGFFFAAPFLLIGGLAQEALVRKTIAYYLLPIALVLLLIPNIRENLLFHPPQRQMQRAMEVASKIMEESQGARFNLAVIAERNYEDGYQYFLERDFQPVVDIDAQRPETITDQLFAVCELPLEKCDPTHNAKAEVANFGWSKIENSWEISGVLIYKLIHSR